MGGAAWVISNVEKEGWEVDLVKGGNIQTFDTKQEFEWNKAEILAAKAAGEDTSYCQFYSSEEAKVVSTPAELFLCNWLQGRLS